MMLALVLALQAAPPALDHGRCLNATAVRLEPSGESASDVAAAVVQACATSATLAQAGSLLTTLPSEQQINLIRQQREIETDQVRLFVVELRACRRTKGCVPRTEL